MIQSNSGAERTSSVSDEWEQEITRPISMDEVPSAKSHVRTIELGEFTIQFHQDPSDNRKSLDLVDALLAAIQEKRGDGAKAAAMLSALGEEKSLPCFCGPYTGNGDAPDLCHNCWKAEQRRKAANG